MLVAVAALAIGLATSTSGSYFCSLLIVLIGVAWFSSRERGISGGEGILLFLFVSSAAIGFWLGAPSWVMLLGVVSSMGAWDLDFIHQRLNRADRVELGTGLSREHLRRLLLVEGIGFTTGLAALTFQTRISFWWVALLVFLVVVGLSWIVTRVRKETGG